MVDGGEVEDDEGAGQVDAGRGGTVEHPPQIAGHQTPELEGHLTTVGGQIGGRAPHRGGGRFVRHQHGVHDRRQRRGRTGVGHLGHGQLDGGAFTGKQDAPETGCRQRRQQLGPPPRGVVARGVTGRGAARRCGRGRGRVKRVQSDGAARSQRHRLDTPGPGQPAVLALGVHHPGPAAEHRLAPQIRFHESALAPPDLTEHDHVGVGEHAAPVEVEGVVGERPAEQVAAHHHAPAAQPRLRRERVGGTEMPGGGQVRRHSHETHPLRDRLRPGRAPAAGCRRRPVPGRRSNAEVPGRPGRPPAPPDRRPPRARRDRRR